MSGILGIRLATPESTFTERSGHLFSPTSTPPLRRPSGYDSADHCTVEPHPSQPRPAGRTLSEPLVELDAGSTPAVRSDRPHALVPDTPQSCQTPDRREPGAVGEARGRSFLSQALLSRA